MEGDDVRCLACPQGGHCTSVGEKAGGAPRGSLGQMMGKRGVVGCLPARIGTAEWKVAEDGSAVDCGTTLCEE
jgi:hypothetical protein